MFFNILYIEQEIQSILFSIFLTRFPTMGCIPMLYIWNIFCRIASSIKSSKSRRLFALFDFTFWQGAIPHWRSLFLISHVICWIVCMPIQLLFSPDVWQRWLLELHLLLLAWSSYGQGTPACFSGFSLATREIILCNCTSFTEFGLFFETRDFFKLLHILGYPRSYVSNTTEPSASSVSSLKIVSTHRLHLKLYEIWLLNLFL